MTVEYERLPSHLINDGVEETPPSQKRKQGPEPGQEDLFADLGDANVGFQHWRPVAVTGRGDRLAGQAEMGGVWEWTSSMLRPHEGFRPMKLYPGYTGEFLSPPPSPSPSTALSSRLPLATGSIPDRC